MTKQLQLLRQVMIDLSIDGMLVVREDEFGGEEVPLASERLCYISGFTGSAGLAIITQDQAVLFSDSRYSLQMEEELSAEWQGITAPPASIKEWLAENLDGQKLGFDPMMMPYRNWKNWQENSNIDWIALAENPIDIIWKDQPLKPVTLAWEYRENDAGMSRKDKIKATLNALDEKFSGFLITAPDELAWLLNIRGQDLSHSPLFLAFAYLDRSGHVLVFTEEKRFEKVNKNNIEIAPPEAINFCLEELLSLIRGKIGIDKNCPYAFYQLLREKAEVLASPIAQLKAIKTNAEIKGSYSIHKRDGLAMCRFLHWLECHRRYGVSETEAGEKLLAFRRGEKNFICPSFATICGADAHGAIVHYRATAGRDGIIGEDSTCLIDSGGHYWEGTTDVTRVIAPMSGGDDAMRYHYTHVLKAHIALDQAIFPHGTTGCQLDAIARQPLWAVGMDFGHGTGHGVGTCLNVHEGPQNISKHGHTVIEKGMIISNEPGFYLADAYGIRIENLLIAQSHPHHEGSLCFDHLTLVPIDKRLLAMEYLSMVEIAWLNAYHQKIQNRLGTGIQALADQGLAEWFVDATAAI